MDAHPDRTSSRQRSSSRRVQYEQMECASIRPHDRCPLLCLVVEHPYRNRPALRGEEVCRESEIPASSHSALFLSYCYVNVFRKTIPRSMSRLGHPTHQWYSKAHFWRMCGVLTPRQYY